MKTQIILLMLLGAVVIFLLGGWLGIFYETQQLFPQLGQLTISQSQAEKLTTGVKALGSKPIQSIMATGQVKSISGTSLTLTYNGDTIVVNARDDTRIVSIIGSKTGIPVIISFYTIKINDFVSVSLDVNQDGTLEAKQIILIPPPSSNNTPPANNTSPSGR